ncbi:hypothetical protein BC829DRAFT_396192 [Chytridium lagenaria]|nr:hypothetical protein BC829DRAFT_396192 [Chytridium lagenaria]
MSPSPSTLIEFLLICGRLKTTKRTGWVKNNVNLPESISDHMYRMGIMAFVIGGSNETDEWKVDKEKCIKMAIVHDLAEAIVGDITPHCKEKAMRDIIAPLGVTGNEMLELWLEYEEGETSNALFVKDLDKLEMIIQAYEYERDQGKNLEEFYESTISKFRHPKIVAMAKSLITVRTALVLP